MSNTLPSTISIKSLVFGILVAIVVYNAFVTNVVRTYALNTQVQVNTNSQRLVAVNNVMQQLFTPATQQEDTTK